MISFTRFFQLLLLAYFSMSFFSCSVQNEEEVFNAFDNIGKGLVNIQYEVPGMNPWMVSTKADNKTEDEKQISSLQLFIFDNNGNYLWHQEENSESLLIDKNWLPDNQPRDKAKLCLLANFPESLEKMESYSKLQQAITKFEGHQGVPKGGLPLIGEEVYDLSSTQQEGEVITINLRSLAARVDFEIYVESGETVGLYEPSFTLLNYELHNFPAGIKLEDPIGETVPINLKSYGGQTPSSSDMIFPGSEPIKFHFYMSEHKRYKNNWNDYPPNIPENAKQRYKPQLAKTDAAYVLLNGTFSDHQGVEHVVRYKIYLGANHTDNFEILRNKQYKNVITIKSITNHDGATEGSITMDHRVNVSQDRFLVSLKRYSNLDCHIEVRPLDIYLTGKGSVRVEIENPEQSSWVRLEKNSKGGAEYCDNFPHTGKRRYFTTDLLSTILRSSYSTTITSNSDNRVWFYFDENPNASKDGMRSAGLRITYIHENGVEDEPVLYTFKQHDMYPVTYNGKTFYMEYYEEYLYNFDPKDGFGDTTDGMKWEQQSDNSIQLSTEDKAIIITSGTLHNKENILSKVSPYYDFDNNKHAYNGLGYTNKLIEARNERELSLETTPRSAAEYCYNKNKRKTDGTVDSVKWYLPATDEIEDIVRGAYTDFRDFQDKYYWSSQPSYQNNQIIFENHANNGEARGTFLSDDKEHARCAKVRYIGGNDYNLITSDSHGFRYKYLATNKPGEQDVRGPFTAEGTFTRDAGNQKRNSINRVRAIYKK
ncbi:MAG: hypothetical protein RR202_03190 [Bacteroidales bacterium]